MSSNLHAVATFPAHRSAPQSPPTWADSRRMVWDGVGELRQQNMKADERRIGQLLAERMERDDDLREASAHLLAHDALVAERVARQRPAPSPKQRIARKVASAKVVKQLAQKARERIWLDLPLMLLSGETKQLRYVTGRELAELGGAYQAVAVKVGDENMVGEVLVEAEVKALLSNV
jgi:hypothetical protein